MIINEQKPIEFINDCNCIVDYDELEKALLWHQDKPTYRLKHIYIHMKYPCISIHNKKIHIHRLLMMYWNTNKELSKKLNIHHKNGDKLDCRKENLCLIEEGKHQYLHNKGKKLTEEHKRKIAENNHKRKGMKYGISKKGITYQQIWDLHLKGYSINKISKELHYDWCQVKLRISEIYENPELLEEK